MELALKHLAPKMAAPSDYTCVSVPHVDLFLFCLCLEDHIFIYVYIHYTYAYFYKNALHLFPSFYSSLPPYMCAHIHTYIASHNCAMFNAWETFLRGKKKKEYGKNTVCSPKLKETIESEESRESANCEF